MLHATLRATPVLLLLLAATPIGVRAESPWSVEVHAGGATNLATPLLIRQAGQADIRTDARWETRPLEPPLYYMVRVVANRARSGWALDLTHHKLHLSDPPAAVANFAISHGYNLLMVHRFSEHGARRTGLGVGAVIAHPESEVRGVTLDEHGGMFRSGYYLAGPCLAASAAWLPWRRGPGYLACEARVTLAQARVPSPGGEARVPNVSAHLTLGLGWRVAR